MDGCVLLTSTPSCVVSPRGETTHSGVDVNNTHPSMINPLNITYPKIYIQYMGGIVNHAKMKYIRYMIIWPEYINVTRVRFSSLNYMTKNIPCVYISIHTYLYAQGNINLHWQWYIAYWSWNTYNEETKTNYTECGIKFHILMVPDKQAWIYLTK